LCCDDTLLELTHGTKLSTWTLTS